MGSSLFSGQVKKKKSLLHYVFILTAVTEMFSLFVLFDVFSGFRTKKGCPDLLPILKDLKVKGQNARDFKR